MFAARVEHNHGAWLSTFKHVANRDLKRDAVLIFPDYAGIA